MNKLTYRKFKSFVRKQPKSRAINHSSGWCACAIGDFLKQAGSNTDWLAAHDFANDVIKPANNRLFITLDGAPGTRASAPKTYGELRVIL